MKKSGQALIGLFLVVLIAILVVSFTKADSPLISPLLIEGKSPSLNLWFPKNSEVFIEGPETTAKAAFFVDTSSGQGLYSKNANGKMPIASLAKIATVVVALEHKALDDDFLVSQKAAEVEPDEMILLPGEKLKLKELLYGIFMVSANDAAEVLAEGSVSSRDEFIKLMNEKAKILGMKNTLFVNPTGLDEDGGSNYSTAYDMAILTRYAIKSYPGLVEISKTPHINIAATKDHQDYEMYSGINLLTTYPGVVGFKTGYTPEAGLTLITLARKDGHEVLGVLLGSEQRREEAKMLLDYSFVKLNP